MHIDFENNGYFVVREFFDDITVKLMQQYWDLKWRQINFFRDNNIQDELRNLNHSFKQGESLTKEDNDVGFSFNFYNDTLMESIELCYGQKASSMLKATLSPTYTFTRIYEKGSPLIPHQDRPSCEVSATCPVFISDDRPSQICISNHKWWEISEDHRKYSIEEIKQKGDFSEVHLYPGDACFYKGCERYHWRDPIESDCMVQFFMHFIQTNGEHKDWVFDKRPFMGFPDRYKGIQQE